MIGRRCALSPAPLAAAFAALLFGLGWGGERGVRLAAADPGGPSAAAAAPAEAAPKVVLLDAGRKPRAPLRYALPSSYKKKIGIIMTMAMDMVAAGQNVSLHLPPIRMEMALTVIEKRKNREVRCKFQVTGADILSGGDKIFEGMRAQLLASLKKVIGAAGTLVMDDRGVVRDMRLDLPPDMDPQMRQAMEGGRKAMAQLSSPLPEEPVGVGARWQMNQLIEENGLKLKQKSVFELVSVKGKKGTLKTTITQSADPQIANLPGLPAGFKAELLSHSGTGTGSGELDLTQLIPSSSTRSVKTDTSIKVTGSGQDQTVQTKADTKVQINRL